MRAEATRLRVLQPKVKKPRHRLAAYRCPRCPTCDHTLKKADGPETVVSRVLQGGDGLRPVVWYTDGEARHSTSTPERKLWAAVLEGCRDDLRLAASVKASPSINTANAEREREWLCSPSFVPQSFLWVCDVLDLEPEATRELLLCPRPSIARGERSSE